ncbi:hypothetical protein PHYSODRAFT_475546 [Phytophthora sojae]|uniref:Uncharacterized protein n=1 Tax=Phytophthora sojae (strain P6497) TaxID=1094619 RepID=G4YDZ8_PHYSP|nr:hypothetical protein PHYSODRAFT_475546 [Phytophthora sojae]EGZ29016.1 hypothetical protein PHYSODRAFT_475546 [Phytophthora sojae]|eukprot:XP_009516291.1 hypothetical protein PHYSODRAFT_475546 [Phytophthora sojae]
MEKPQPPSPLSKWIRPKASTRRILLLGTVLYASVVLFWSAHSIGAFTSRLDRVPVEIKDFPSGDVSQRQLKCIGWRATRGCSPDGAREPESDQNCTQIVSKGESGYCEAEDINTGERFRVMRRKCNSLPRHNVPFRCDDAQEFINFRVQAHNTSQKALHPSFKLPNVGKQEEGSPRDGIVMVVYPKLLASAYAAIRVLREVLSCQLPVEIWFRPDEIQPNDAILKPLKHLAATLSNITFQEINDPMAKKFVAKIHAIYHSTFDRLLFLDADNVPVRDPTFLFESPEFVRTGAIFWPDFWHPRSTIFGVHENSLLWELLDMPFVDMFEQESGQLVVNRRRHAAPLELVRFYALHRPDFFSSLRLVWGDKDLFRLAWLKLNVPFAMIQTPPGMAGTVYDAFLRSDFCGMTMVQHDAEGEILFMHRNQHKLTGTFTDEAKEENLHEKTVDAVDVVSAPVERYADPKIWTHLMRFHKGSSRRYYSIQNFVLDLDFEHNQKCYGRRDVYRNPHFYIQEVAALNFSELETQLRRFALQSTQFSLEA